MNKEKFLEILRRTLEGQVSQKIIDENIRYYNNYISSNSKQEEQEKLDELGEPTLIGKTIIAKEQAAREKTGRSSGYGDSSESYRSHQNYGDNRSKNENKYNVKFKWYYYIIIVLVLFVLLTLVLSVGRILFRLFFSFGLPVFIIISLISIFRRR